MINLLKNLEKFILLIIKKKKKNIISYNKMGKGKSGLKKMQMFGGNDTFSWMDKSASLIGCLAFLACVVLGFWTIISMIFGFPNPQDSWGVRRVKNCTRYVEPGQDKVNCEKIWVGKGRNEVNNY